MYRKCSDVAIPNSSNTNSRPAQWLRGSSWVFFEKFSRNLHTKWRRGHCWEWEIWNEIKLSNYTQMHSIIPDDTQRWTAAAVCHMSWFLFFTHYTNKIHSSSHSLLGKTSHKSRQKTQLTSCSEIFSPEESFPPRIGEPSLPPSWWWRFPDLNGRCWGMLGLFPRSLFRLFPKWMFCLDVCRISDVFGCYFLLLVELGFLTITMKKITTVGWIVWHGVTWNPTIKKKTKGRFLKAPGGFMRDFWSENLWENWGSEDLIVLTNILGFPHDPNLGGWWCLRCFIFTPKIGEMIPNLTHIFQRGWNHQLEMGCFE